jgi:hypothetical protein
VSGEIAKRIIASRQADMGGGPPDDEVEDCAPSFGFLRGSKERAQMFEIRYHDGKLEAFTYSWLDHAIFDPSEGITLHFSRKKVRLTGRNLNAEVRPNLRLWEAILRHRVPWIKEADEPTALSAPRHALVIERVVVE